MSLNNSYTKKRNSSFSSYSSYSSNNISTKSSTIKVAIRLRPLLPHEDFEYWTVDINKNIIASKSENKKSANESFSSINKDGINFMNKNKYLNQLLLDNVFIPQTFKFDKIFTKDITSEKIYLDICQDIIKQFINGINGTIFVYGQTTSGKTYTMLGNINYPGILPCALKNLFDLLEHEKKSHNFNYNLYCSYIEIYNEVIHDLIGDATGCKIVEDNNYGLVIPEAQKICINSFEEGIQLKDIGEEKRQYKDTIINEYSSRSHTIFQLYLETSIQDKEKNTLRNKYSLLNLVDLAGSERLNNCEKNIPNNNNETGYINKSLFALSNVINKLSENKNIYIPYRDSKLTRLLSKGLGGGALVTIICNVSPSANNFFQTVSTLRFAYRAKHIKIKPAINERIIKKLKEKSDNGKNLIIQKNGSGGYNIFNNNIYNILNQSGSENNEIENISNKNYEIKYYELLLKNKKLIAENNKLKNNIEELTGNNNIGENFIDDGIEKIRDLLVKYNVDNEFNKFINNNLKNIKMNYINQIKSFQISTISKLNEIQNIIIQNFNTNDSSENNNEEINKELFSEIDLNFDNANKITEVKFIYEQKEKQLESLMKKYKENIDYYFDNLLNKNENKNNKEIIYKEYQEKINELEKLYEKAQNALEQKFFEKLKNITKFNKQIY
jgi:hypothetical protein